MSLIKVKPFATVNEIPQNSTISFDTSMVWRLFGDKDTGNDPKLKNELNTFIKGTAKRNSSIVLTTKVHEELNILSTAVTIGPKDKRKEKLNQDRMLMNKPMDLVDLVLTRMSELPNFYEKPIGVVDDTIIANARKTVREVGLEYPDATIYQQTKSQSDIEFLATYDADFHLLNDEELTLFVPGFKAIIINRERQKMKKDP